MNRYKLTLVLACMAVTCVCGCNEEQPKPEDRIFDDQAMKFFWFGLTPIALVAMTLAAAVK